MMEKHLKLAIELELERYKKEIENYKQEVWEKEQELLTDEYNFLVEITNRLIDSRDSYWKCQKRLINPKQIKNLYNNILVLIELRFKKVEGQIVEFRQARQDAPKEKKE